MYNESQTLSPFSWKGVKMLSNHALRACFSLGFRLTCLSLLFSLLGYLTPHLASLNPNPNDVVSRAELHPDLH